MYNYLLDKIEDYIDDDNFETYIKEAANIGANKIKEYYSITSGYVYIIATSKLN
jgi:hypothetical protein